MKRLVAAILFILFVASMAQASNYVFRDGYWWYDGIPYTRVLYSRPGYWYNGCYYAGSSYYEYTRVANYVAPQAVTYTDPGWKGKLLDIAAQRDKYEGEIRKNAFEQAYFLESVKALGLQNNFTWHGYGTIPPYALGGNGGYGVMPMPYSYEGNVLFGANAGTQYGYSYQALSKVYGDNDLAQLYQMANQHVLNAQKLAGDGQAGFGALAQTEGQNRAKVAEILAKGQIVAHIMQSLSSGPEIKGMSFKFSSGGKIEKVESNVDPAIKKNLSSEFATLVNNRCASCHSGGTKKGGFDIAVYPSLSDDQKQIVWSRLVAPDDKSVMPQPGPGQSVKRLTPQELRLFFLN